jgi:predicted AlkP superfamily pyrophosphatase or phosphodiesterase
MNLRTISSVLLLSSSLVFMPVHAQVPPNQPALVLGIVVDQMRYDYLSRYGNEFTGGLARLVQDGAVFTNANYEASPTVTAVGHSTIMSGATPSMSGIAANSWYERSEGAMVQSITDNDVTPLGGGNGASPKRLAVTTVGDELKASGKGGKVFGVSLKDRSAILPPGRGADGAFWFDAASGNFVSSSWYFPALPAWAQAFNDRREPDRYLGEAWMGLQMPATVPALYGELDATPFADQLVLDFALTLMQEEQLGRGDKTDLLTVSFSAMDYLGHGSGPDTEQMHAMVLSIDAKVGTLLQAAERQAGRGKVLVVFTADHGVAPVPEEQMEKQLPGGRYSAREERDALISALVASFGEGDYLQAGGDTTYYLNEVPVPGKTISYSDLEAVAAEALRAQPHVWRVYTRSELTNGVIDGDRITQRVRNGFSADRSGDLIVIHDPNWLGGGGGGTTHGSPFSYDTHVPVIFWGSRNLIKPGIYNGEAGVHDIAPTLTTLLGIARPSGALGRTLDEIMP